MTSTLAYIPSPSQGVWHLGPFPLRAYALFIIAGIIVALTIGDRRWEQRGGERGVIYDIALWAVPFGLLGGRLYHVLTDWPTYFGDGGAGLWAAVKVWDGGLGIWGAVALGGVGAWIACRRRGIPLPAFGDAIAPGIVLAQAIGRLGNYFNQELYGRPTTMPWGLEIYERVNANGMPDSLNGVATGPAISVVHPTFLYELLWNVLAFAVLIWADRRFKLGHGRLFALYVAGYCVGRFWIELMRSDTATLIAGIRVNSFTSTFVFIGAVVYIMVAPKGREDPATLRGNAGETRDEDSAVKELAKELTVVASTTGSVAAVTVAAQAERKEAEGAGPEDPGAEAHAGAESLMPDAAEGETESFAIEDSEFFGEAEAPEADEADVEPQEGPHSEAAVEAEELAAEVADAPAEEVIEAQEVAEAGERATELEVAAEAEAPVEPEGDELDSEAVVEADELAAEVADAPVEEIVESDEVAEVAEQAAGLEPEPVAEAAAEADAVTEVPADVEAAAEAIGDESSAGTDVTPESGAADDSKNSVDEVKPKTAPAVGHAVAAASSKVREYVNKPAVQKRLAQAEEVAGRVRRWVRQRRS